MSQGPRHALCLKRLERHLRSVEERGYHLHIQLPVTVSTTSEPEPDLTVVRGGAEDYQHQHPTPHDVVLVVEVADSSLDYDRTTKLRTYARAGIPRYWIVNIRDRRIEVYESPDTNAASYREATVHGLGQIVQVVDEGRHLLQVAVQDLLA
jgi:Uma2 family endonuclease